ncbi:MAG: hypothetical protein V7K95_12065 [Nostoc sp.]
MPLIEAPPQDWWQSHQELHFQPEAGNEILTFLPRAQDGRFE